MKVINVRIALVLFLGLLLQLGASGCSGKGLTLENATQHDLLPYPVVTNPPPPRRAPDIGNEIPPGQTASIDADGFNPLYYASTAADEGPNALFIGLAVDEEPIQIQYKVMRYPVPPDELANNPGSQPQVIQQDVVEVENLDVTITVKQGPSATGASLWQVTITPN